MKKLMLLSIIFILVSCIDDAQRASYNLTKAADNFEVERRIVFFNGITDQYLLTIQGRCSTFNRGNLLEVICQTGIRSFKKHFLGLSDNVSYFVEQLEPVKASAFSYRVTFKPKAIIPNIDVRN